VKDVLPPAPHDALRAGIELPEYLRRWKKDV